MIPTSEDLSANMTVQIEPTHTYKLHYETDSRVVNYADGLEAMRQAVYKILQTERYHYLIYSWNYGIELEDLFGMPIPYVYSELERRVTEALLQDDRITEVTDFEFSNKDEEVLMKFSVTTTEGTTEIAEVVNFNNV